MHILIVAGQYHSLINFRGDLIKKLINCGHKVSTAAPLGGLESDDVLRSWGVNHHNISLRRTGLNVLVDLQLLFELHRLIKSENPDVVLSYTVKPVVYSAIAARLAGVPQRVAIITGLGFSFAPSASLQLYLVRCIARLAYKVGMVCTKTVFFQNPDDEADFRRLRLVSESQRVFRICGSGVNLERFAVNPYPTGPIRFLMVSRLLVDKGVLEYLRAAAIVRSLDSEVAFDLVGPVEEHPAAVPYAEIESAVANGVVRYHGYTCDVRPFLRDCHVYVLPSYREGTPRSVLEAMATGRPIITTDVPGCKETVIHGFNGLLVPPRSIDALVQAMLLFLKNRHWVAVMGESSRKIAEEKYDVHKINKEIIDRIGL
jgi:glycosyltransferase involved in cell wall biosynthesis